MQNRLWFLAWHFSIRNYDNRLISFDIKTQVMEPAHASKKFKTIAQQRKAWRFQLSEGIKTRNTKEVRLIYFDQVAAKRQALLSRETGQ